MLEKSFYFQIKKKTKTKKQIQVLKYKKFI